MIVYFSGTGNSAYVAKSLGRYLNDFNLQEMDFNLSPVLDFTKESRVVWVMPVHAWGVPKFVKSFIRKLSVLEGGDINHFLVATCGDDMGLMNIEFKKLLKQKNIKLKSSHCVIMPNTYVCLPGFDVDRDSVTQQKLSDAVGRIKSCGHAIKCASPIDNVIPGKYAWLKSRVLRPIFNWTLISPKKFKVSMDKCIKCKRCINQCPLKNIRIVDGEQIVWGENCTMCLGCYHICPNHAINYGRFTSHKGQWLNSDKLC